MTDQELTTEYLQAFQDGYLLAKHEPELAKQLSKVEMKSERGLGFKDGIEQMSLDKAYERLPDKFKSVSNVTKHIDQDKERDKDIDLEV